MIFEIEMKEFGKKHLLKNGRQPLFWRGDEKIGEVYITSDGKVIADIEDEDAIKYINNKKLKTLGIDFDEIENKMGSKN